MTQHDPNFIANKNLLRVNKYRIIFLNLKELMYLATSVNIPDVSLNLIKRPTGLVDYPIAGSKFQYNQSFSIDFMIDEDLRNYDSIYRWMLSLAPTDDLEDYGKEFMNQNWALAPHNMRAGVTDATVQMITNSYASNYEFLFQDCFPYMLSGPKMETNTSSPSPVFATANFAFSRFKLRLT
jgi:hypothetical protein